MMKTRIYSKEIDESTPGVPYVILGSLVYMCQKGMGRHIAQRTKHHSRKSEKVTQSILVPDGPREQSRIYQNVPLTTIFL